MAAFLPQILLPWTSKVWIYGSVFYPIFLRFVNENPASDPYFYAQGQRFFISFLPVLPTKNPPHKLFLKLWGGIFPDDYRLLRCPRPGF